MFLVVNLLAGAILFVVDLLVFLRGEVATVGFAIGMYLLIDLLLMVLRPCGLAGGHLPTADAVGDALLLVRTALIHSPHSHGVWPATVD